MIVVDIHILESLHLERIKIDVQRKQIKWKISHLYKVIELIDLEELFADNSTFRPKTWEVPFVAFVTIDFDELLQG